MKHNPYGPPRDPDNTLEMIVSLVLLGLALWGFVEFISWVVP